MEWVKDLGKTDITTLATDGNRTLMIDWLDFGVSIITIPFEGGCEAVGSFNWKRDSAEEISDAIYEAFVYVESE